MWRLGQSTDGLLLVSARDIKKLPGQSQCEHNNLMSQAVDCGIRDRARSFLAAPADLASDPSSPPSVTGLLC